MSEPTKHLDFLVGLLHAIAASHQGNVMLVGNVRAEQIVEICKHTVALTQRAEAAEAERDALRKDGDARADACCPCVARAAGGRRMSDPTKVMVYVAPQGTWLPFVDEDGVHDALDLSKPMRLVAERDYAKLAQGYVTLRAERDALRTVATGWCAECKGMGFITVHTKDSANSGNVMNRRCVCALAVQP